MISSVKQSKTNVTDLLRRNKATSVSDHRPSHSFSAEKLIRYLHGPTSYLIMSILDTSSAAPGPRYPNEATWAAAHEHSPWGPETILLFHIIRKSSSIKGIREPFRMKDIWNAVCPVFAGIRRMTT